MILKKQDISELPLLELAAMNLTELETWCEANLLHRFSGWLLPQLVARIGSWTLAKVDGKIDILATFKQACENPQNRGLWQLSRVSRSLLIKNQVREPDYASFTPIILLAFKRVQGIPYESWRGLPNLEWVLEPVLYECCCLGSEQTELLTSISPSRVLEIRQLGLTPRTGKSMLPKKAESTWRLFHVDDTEFGILPIRTQTMVAQCWLAHPTNRRNTMILDPLNWDNVPAPLVSNDIFTPQPETKTKKPSLKLEMAPW